MVNCKVCSKEIARNSKCPHCGKDNRFFYSKHKVLIAISTIVLIIFVSICTPSKEDMRVQSNIKVEIYSNDYNEYEIKYSTDTKQMTDLQKKDYDLKLKGKYVEWELKVKDVKEDVLLLKQTDPTKRGTLDILLNATDVYAYTDKKYTDINKQDVVIVKGYIKEPGILEKCTFTKMDKKVEDK
jgi:hypothetical protein